MKIPGRAASIALAALVGIPAGIALASCENAEAAPTTVCDRFGTVAGPGGFYQNNVYGSTARQCASVDGTTFKITESGHDRAVGGQPAAYPSYVTGRHWNNEGPAVGLPVRVDQVASANASWYINANQPDGMTKLPGTWNAASEFWTHSAPRTECATGSESTCQPDGTELMVWLDSSGVTPAGSKVATANLLGATWDVWHTMASDGVKQWHYVAYVRQQRSDRLIGDMAAFIRDSQARGWVKPTDYLIAQETGFEIWKAGAGLALTGYNVAYVKKAAPTTSPGC